MRKPLTFAISIASFLLTTYAAPQQIVLSQPELTIQNELYQAAENLFETNSIETSCSSCISLLHVLKKMSYFSESFLVSSLTKVCKKTGRVDDEVVSKKKSFYISLAY